MAVVHSHASARGGGFLRAVWEPCGVSQNSAEYPHLRAVEAFPVDVAGRTLLCLRDPMNVSTRIIGVPPPALFLISLMDGKHSLLDIQTEYLKRFGEIVPTPDLEKLIADLDESLMLEGPHFEAYLAELDRSWREAPERPQSHVGSGYEGDPSLLAGQIEGFFTDAEGPGAPPAPGSESKPLAGIIAPHIDYTRGGPTYAWAYRELLRDGAADTYVILGTSHVPLSRYFSVTRKNFATPFGPIATDTAFVDQLEKRMGEPLETDPLVHRGEHSVELQTVWLSYLMQRRAIRIVPILCGSLGPMIMSGEAPQSDPEVKRFIEALRATLRDYGDRAVLIAAADLAHMGTGFGDPEPPSDAAMREVEEADRQSMDAAVRLDAADFFGGIQAEQDRRKICGLSPIYAFLETIDAQRGELLKYRQCNDPTGFRNVTIASAAFYR